MLDTTKTPTTTTTFVHGVPWEDAYGVAQAYCAKGLIFISGQFSHDMEGNFVGAGDITAQTRQTLDNLDRVLAGFDVTRRNLAELEMFLTDPAAHFEPCVSQLKDYLGGHRTAATLVGVSGLAFPHQLIEIRAVAHTD